SAVGMLGTRVDLELLDLLISELVLGEHAADGLLHCLLGILLEELGVGDAAEAARVAGMAVGELRLTLVAGQRDLVGVDDDDEVARIHMGCEDRLVLPPQELGSLGSEPAEDDIRCVDDVPGTLDIAGLRGERTHSCLLLSWWCQVGRTPSGHGSNGPWARFLRVKAWPLWLYPARSADHATAGLDVGEIPIAPHRERTAAESGTHRGTTTAHPTGRGE